ncbi:uncharacterized protein DS421_16g538800 [Arachis hypogaea]|nr:uncharacterized protein DS421_16g538800 [Arachis hypogaea]
MHSISSMDQHPSQPSGSRFSPEPANIHIIHSHSGSWFNPKPTNMYNHTQPFRLTTKQHFHHSTSLNSQSRHLSHKSFSQFISL